MSRRVEHLYDTDPALQALQAVQTGHRSRMPWRAIGLPPDVVQRARARGVVPYEIQALRDDYRALVPRRPPFQASAFGLLTRHEFYMAPEQGDEAVHVVERVTVTDAP
ncbi:MAG: hypothetical protein KF894_08895 [Labilithrix sp.]|nr:hypothetical protein [Labilithrix sp.]